MLSANYIAGQLKQLGRMIYPKARAFFVPEGGILDRLHAALAKSKARAMADAISTLDSAIADNPNFTADDATDWERRLGIASGGSAVPLDDRKKAINRKLNHPGTQKARQSARYIQAQLQAAGFNVFVYENKFPDGSGGFITKTPDQILGTALGAAYHKTAVHHGKIVHGATFKNIIANYIDQAKDTVFVPGPTYRNTFFIAGATITTFANVPPARKNEFRQLILTLKPAEAVGFLFINYV